MDFQERITKLLEQHGISQPSLEVPPNPALGDYAFPCFPLAKELKKAPPVIAAELTARITAGPDAGFLEKVLATGPYVNFFIKPGALAEAVIGAINTGRFWQFGSGQRRILIEYPSPNTNKPLHLGHVRNMVLGSTLVRVLKRDGNIVIPVNLTNDRGVHICKSMLAYQRWGNGKDPDKKSDHYVGDFYVLFAKKKEEDPRLEDEAQQMLVRWEQGDAGVRSLWKKMNTWALDGHQATYQRYGVSFEKEYLESEIYQDGKDIVLRHKEQLKEEDGALIAPLEQFRLPDKVLLRKDGTSIYMTQDIALTIRKMEEFKPDLQMWIVGNEQNLHFQQLFAVLELFGVKGRESFLHFSYGMVSLPEGRMKSREGTVVDADDIIEELEELATAEIAKRHEDWMPEQVKEKARIVAMGAIRFFMVKFDPLRDFVFDPKSSLSFEGDSGPYLQYTHARLCSILGKAEYPPQADLTLLAAPEEQELLRQLALMPQVCRKAASDYKLHLIANQLLEVGRAFNSFYHACPVLTAPEDVRAARIHLLEATRRVIDEGLDLLGIAAPREM